MSQRIPVNPGRVEWSGENPGIYLKQDPAGDWSALGIFFRVVLSPHGRGHTMIVLDQPTSASGYPESNNVCLSDNEPLTRYLIDGFVSRFPSFKDKAGLQAMTHIPLEAVRFEGDMKDAYREVASGGGLEVVMEWRRLGDPMAVEVGPEDCATREHDMYSVFLEAAEASISVNGRTFPGRVADRLFFGKTMSTAFLALSEIWVTP